MNKFLILMIAAAFGAMIFTTGCAPAETDEPNAAETHMMDDGMEMAGEEHADGEHMMDDGTMMEGDEHAAGGSDSSMDVVTHTNENGELVCPVMNTVIDSPEAAVGYEDVDGTRYFFCCDACPDTFRAEPERYIEQD